MTFAIEADFCRCGHRRKQHRHKNKTTKARTYRPIPCPCGCPKFKRDKKAERRELQPLPIAAKEKI